MPFHLDRVVPWGRSFEEYVAMFALSDADLALRLLGCGDGPAGFNAHLTARGGRVLSADPLYQFPPQAIGRRIAETTPQVLEQTRLNPGSFVWDRIRSVEQLGRIRTTAMEAFLEDYAQPRGRYVAAALPRLPFRDRAFGLALCSHFLFLYGDRLSAAFHIDSIREMCRVAKEARVFPLVELDAKRSRHIEAVVAGLEAEGFRAEIETVPYEFQKGGNRMLRVARD